MIVENPVAESACDSGMFATALYLCCPGSSAIDKGSNGFRIQFDQCGVPRVRRKRSDIGAFESDLIFGNGFDP